MPTLLEELENLNDAVNEFKKTVREYVMSNKTYIIIFLLTVILFTVSFWAGWETSKDLRRFGRSEDGLVTNTDDTIFTHLQVDSELGYCVRTNLENLVIAYVNPVSNFWRIDFEKKVWCDSNFVYTAKVFLIYYGVNGELRYTKEFWILDSVEEGNVRTK